MSINEHKCAEGMSTSPQSSASMGNGLLASRDDPRAAEEMLPSMGIRREARRGVRDPGRRARAVPARCSGRSSTCAAATTAQ